MKIIKHYKPIKFYKYSYSLLFSNTLKEIDDPILALSSSCDCILSNDIALFFTNRAPNIFDLEKRYKALAKNCLNSIENPQRLFQDFDDFYNFASKWPKATKFQNFNSQDINLFSSYSFEDKTRILQPFNIKVNSDGTFKIYDNNDKEKVLNFMCGKLLTNFRNQGFEVNYPTKIN